MERRECMVLVPDVLIPNFSISWSLQNITVLCIFETYVDKISQSRTILLVPVIWNKVSWLILFYVTYITSREIVAPLVHYAMYKYCYRYTGSIGLSSTGLTAIGWNLNQATAEVRLLKRFKTPQRWESAYIGFWYFAQLETNWETKTARGEN